MTGEPSAAVEPKTMLGRVLFALAEPPFGIVTEEGLREWSAPFAMEGAPPTEGTAGWIGFCGFTGDAECDFPCWMGAELPTATGGLLEAMTGGVEGFLVPLAVALAYEDLAVGCAGTAGRGDVLPEPEPEPEETAMADCAACCGGADDTVLVI